MRTEATESIVDEHTPTRAAAQRLRNTLRANALTSAIGGLITVAVPHLLDGLLDTDRIGLVRATGAGLVVFAAAVGAAAGSRTSRLMRLTRVVIAADVAWIGASVVSIVADWFALTGDLIVGAVAAMVTLFVVLQIARAGSIDQQQTRLIDESPPIEVVHIAQVTRIDPHKAWEIITDHELYGRLAPNLSNVHAHDGDGPSLTRSCTNRRGAQWHEACTLWRDGERFEVAVDTSKYPYPLQVMRGAWWVAPRTGGTVIGMDFRYQPRPGLRGRVFAALMQAVFPLVLRRILGGFEREGTTLTPRTERT